MSEFEKLNRENADDLDWMAFCYVADELAGEQLTQFERRLSEDQEAREAVAHAMKLSSEVLLSGVADHQISTPSRSEASVRPGWLWQTVALVLLGVTFGAWWWTTSNGDPAPTLVDTSSEALAVAWVDTLDDSEWSELDSELKEELGFDDEPVNEWMLVALSELEESEQELPN